MFKPKLIKRSLIALIILFVLMNIVAYQHAYQFTHFSTSATAKTKDAKHLSFGEKIKTLVFGISNPRPINKKLPSLKYEEIILQSNVKISGWYIPADSAKGTVILFHGYSGEKSGMLDKADFFNEQGYNTFLIDFMGAGGSEGNQITVGYYETEEVKTAFDYIKHKGENNILLYGTSMGAVAIMKAINDYNIKPTGIMIECPFGNFLQTVQARFKTMHVPTFPMSQLLVFWGGQINDFNAFNFNPTEYAKKISVPTLLMFGAKDEKVSRQEIDEIFKNLKGKKQLAIYPNAAHENYLKKYKKEWNEDIKTFLK